MYFSKCAIPDFLDVDSKRRKKAEVAEADKDDNEEEASTMQTTMKPMGERRKAMSRKMMREKEREKKLEEFGLRRNFQIFIKLVIIPR